MNKENENHVELSTMWLDHGGKESLPIDGSRMGEPPPHMEKGRGQALTNGGAKSGGHVRDVHEDQRRGDGKIALDFLSPFFPHLSQKGTPSPLILAWLNPPMEGTKKGAIL